MVLRFSSEYIQDNQTLPPKSASLSIALHASLRAKICYPREQSTLNLLIQISPNIGEQDTQHAARESWKKRQDVWLVEVEPFQSHLLTPLVLGGCASCTPFESVVRLYEASGELFGTPVLVVDPGDKTNQSISTARFVHR